MRKLNFKRPTKNQIFMGLGVMLVTAGLLMGGLNEINSLLNTRGMKVEAQGLKNTAPIKNDNPLITGAPNHISIPDVSINLEVIPGYYNSTNKSWTLTLDKAQWGAMTPKPNNKAGATYIYGHYRVHVFYTLPKIQPGSLATVTTENGHTFTYKFVNSTVITPENTSILTYQGKPILVLQTCTGALYHYRQLFVFELVQVDNKTVSAQS